MTFNDYVQIIGDGRSWDHFQKFMGGNRVRTRAKLEQLRDLRNVVFHFKREITMKNTRPSPQAGSGCCLRHAPPKHVERRPNNERSHLEEDVHRQGLLSSSGPVRSKFLFARCRSKATSCQRSRHGQEFCFSSHRKSCNVIRAGATLSSCLLLPCCLLNGKTKFNELIHQYP